MPGAVAYRRAPLVDLAYTPLTDAAVHTEGLQKTLEERALKLVDVSRMSALDAVLATKLGGYEQMPPMPDVEAAAVRLPDDVPQFMETVRGAAFIATANRDKDGLVRVLGAMRVFASALTLMPEEALFAVGADALRLSVDLYRRTGQRFLLELMENLRSRLPDVSGVLHVFPFQQAFEVETGTHTPQEQQYYDRLQRFATGKWMADTLAMTALLSQYSGSGREAQAAMVGMANLDRYHGMPGGAFSADPYLAGRDPSRAVDLGAACAYAEACLDSLCAGGDMAAAEKLEMLLLNVLPDFVTADGLRTLASFNRLAGDDSCQTAQAPEGADVSAVLRALYAVRRAVWMTHDENTLAYLLPVSGGCLTRLNGVPVRVTAEVSGSLRRQITLRVECRQPVSGTLRLRIPAYADAAQISIGGEKPRAVNQGGMVDVRRTFQNGDVIQVTLTLSPRTVAGFRGSVSVYVGAELMAMPLPTEDAGWRYAAVRSMPMSGGEEDGKPYVLVAACEAPQWQEKDGFILPPPQGVPMSAAYEITFLPAAGMAGRIAALPCALER